MNYYNENDPKAAAWIRELINQGHIPAGHVDERSITEIQPHELQGFTQCHFFAGIAGWSLALRYAGWPDAEPVWTGSCPCQPFSVAGKGLGTADERHLWPVFGHLIGECKPPVVFGEQTSSKAGRDWLAGVFADLEGMGYQRAGADLCAAGVGEDGEGRIVRGDQATWERITIGAPHIRQRLYWVADSGSQSAGRGLLGPGESAGAIVQRTSDQSGGSGGSGGMADANGRDASAEWQQRSGEYGLLAECDGACGVGNSEQPRLERCRQFGINPISQGREGKNGYCPTPSGGMGHWSHCAIIPCADGKARRVEPGIQLLAHGFPGRVGLLRGFGNAIVPQLAAEFIQAFAEARQLT